MDDFFRGGAAHSFGLAALVCALVVACSGDATEPGNGSPVAGSGGMTAPGGGSAGTSGAPAAGTGGTAPGGAGSSTLGGAGLGGASPAGAGGTSGGNDSAGAAGTAAIGGGAGSSGSAGSSSAAGAAGSTGGTSTDCDATAPATDAALRARCTGTSPITCSFGGAPGHYDVTMLLGGPATGNTVITAESRRFLLGTTETPSGGNRCVSFTVNVRAPEGEPIQDVPAGTPGLNFRLEGSAPQLQAVGLRPAQNPLVLYIAGDSTVCDQAPQLEKNPNLRFTGWGQMLPQFFRHGVSVTNYADSGEGTQAFRTDGGSLWAPIQRGMKAGDYVFIQLGHNDKTTPAATYRSRITGMVRAVKAASAIPVVISPIARNSGGALAEQHIYDDLDVRRELQQITTAESVAFVDLMAITHEWMTRVGRTTAQTYFVGTDGTHTNQAGGQLFAEFLVQALRAQNIGIASRLR